MSEQPLTPEERGDLHVLLARAAATGEALWVASWALALPHRLDDKLCGCDSCMDYAGEDEGFAWDRLPPASRIILRVLDSGDDRFEPIRAAIREHDIDPTPPASAVPETRDLDVDRLARAMDNMWPSHAEGMGGTGDAPTSTWDVMDPAVPHPNLVKAIAAEYARLAATPPGPTEETE